MHIRSMFMASVMVVSLAACAFGPAAAPAPTGPQVINVTLTTYATKFSPDKVKPGVTVFKVKNDAKDVSHEFWLIKTNLPVDQIPKIADGTKIDEESTAFTKLDSVDDLPAGATGMMTVTLQAGRYVYFCNQPGHYMAGMRGELNVAP